MRKIQLNKQVGGTDPLTYEATAETTETNDKNLLYWT